MQDAAYALGRSLRMLLCFQWEENAGPEAMRQSRRCTSWKFLENYFHPGFYTLRTIDDACL